METQYWANEIARQIFASVIAAVFSLGAGFIFTWVNRRRIRERQKSDADIDRIAQVARADDDIRTEAVLSTIKENLALRDSSKEVAESLDRLRGAIRLAVPPNEFPAVENLVSSYHEQALSQANVQFWFSVAAATAGFVWILYAAMDIKPDNLITISKTLPGVVMDAVAFLFFKQASETRQRATELYDRLRRDRQSANSVALVEAIPDAKVRSAVQAQIALHMAGLQPTPIDLTKFLSSVDPDRSPRAEETVSTAQEAPATG